MPIFLDARTSQNASFANSIGIAIPAINTPQLFGQIGLSTTGVGANPRVLLNGTVTVQLPLALVGITITVVRGTLATDPIVYSATQTFDLSVVAPQVITFSAADFNPTISSTTLTYTAFISTNLLGTTRVGPENFVGLLASD